MSALATSHTTSRCLRVNRPSALITSRSLVRATKPHRLVLVRADPKEGVEKAIIDAQEACKDGSAEECANAWDTVEELSAAASHKKSDEITDPLDAYCKEVPESDECRVYDDI